MLAVKNRKTTGIELWWKRRMTQVKQLKKDLRHTNTLTERKKVQKKDGLIRRYNMKRMGLPVTREEIKERIKTKNNKIKRYQRRINQYHQNYTFKNNQGKFYMELNCGGRDYDTTKVPDKKKVQEFWRSIWGESKKHQKNVDWLENFKRSFAYKEEPE